MAVIHIHSWICVEVATSSVAAVRQRDTYVLKDLAKELNFTYTAFGPAVFPEDDISAGALTLTDAWGNTLEPVPVTPAGEDSESARWQLLSGTIKATFNSHRSLDGATNIFVIPGIAETRVRVPFRFALNSRLTYMGHAPQIQRPIGNSRATSSGTTIKMGNTESILVPSMNVCFYPQSSGRGYINKLCRHTSRQF